MKLYVTSPKNWTAELATVLQVATSDDVIVVDSEDRRELAERAAARLNFKGRIEVELPKNVRTLGGF